MKTGAVAPDHSLTLVARNRASTGRERFSPASQSCFQGCPRHVQGRLMGEHGEAVEGVAGGYYQVLRAIEFVGDGAVGHWNSEIGVP
jgi:hypothetical protein